MSESLAAHTTLGASFGSRWYSIAEAETANAVLFVAVAVLLAVLRKGERSKRHSSLEAQPSARNEAPLRKVQLRLAASTPKLRPSDGASSAR